MMRQRFDRESVPVNGVVRKDVEHSWETPPGWHEPWVDTRRTFALQGTHGNGMRLPIRRGSAGTPRWGGGHTHKPASRTAEISERGRYCSARNSPRPVGVFELFANGHGRADRSFDWPAPSWGGASQRRGRAGRSRFQGPSLGGEGRRQRRRRSSARQFDLGPSGRAVLLRSQSGSAWHAG